MPVIFEKSGFRNKSIISLIFSFIIIFAVSGKSFSSDLISPSDILNLKSCSEAVISPDGRWIAYTVSLPRSACDKPGEAYKELYTASSETAEIRPFITGKVKVSSPRWKPGGSEISFICKRGSNKTSQIWTISMNGGEARQLSSSKTAVKEFRWHPDGMKIAYTAVTPKSRREEQLAEKGYAFKYFEENLKHRNLYQIDLQSKETVQLTEDVTVWDFEYSPDGNTIAASISKKNLIDHKYMFRKIYLLNTASQELKELTNNQGKLGNYAFSPDGSKIVYTAALERKDHAVSQAYVMDIKHGKEKNLTETNFKGHIEWACWKDNKSVFYLAGEGLYPTLSSVNAAGGSRSIILDAKKEGIIFEKPSFSKDFKKAAFIGSTPKSPEDVYFWQAGKGLKRITNVNPNLAEKTFGEQKAVRYKARDGKEIEGILIYPVNYQSGTKYPLIVVVHGGPESHYSNGWMSSYSRPGQVLAGRGYAVFYPNYRASTGYGVEFAAEGYKDAAGAEFDDIADGIDYLVSCGIADKNRVGLGGGSYGGFAAAWFSSYYTKYVKAVSMFVGISNLISKRGTTDIPYEELYVHSGRKLEEMWDQALKRSPIYYAHQSKTAVLILGGEADSRVHPSQSIEYFRRLKMNDHPAVRLVQYPGEKHGNREQPGRTDLLYRMLDWYDWYVKDLNPLDGPMPPLDISSKYGLKLDK